jgi:hypothetical protein
MGPKEGASGWRPFFLRLSVLSDTARAMSEENVERFLKATEAFNRGDKQAWLATYDPDASLSPKSPRWRALTEGAMGLERSWQPSLTPLMGSRFTSRTFIVPPVVPSVPLVRQKPPLYGGF